MRGYRLPLKVSLTLCPSPGGRGDLSLLDKPAVPHLVSRGERRDGRSIRLRKCYAGRMLRPYGFNVSIIKRSRNSCGGRPAAKADWTWAMTSGGESP